MNNKLFTLTSIVLVLAFLSIGLVNASSNSCNPTIKLVNQDPSPAIPNDYVKVIFEITGLGDCEGFAIKLNLEYPFSLDSNSSSVQTLEGNPFALDYRNVWMAPYKIRVDPAAFDGDYNLKIDYHEGNSEDFIYTTYFVKDFNITIKDSRTSFDAVIQEATSSEVSIAIANIGKYTANSVVVRIPEQDSFTTTGVDGQMVGNLESGIILWLAFQFLQNR